ncbi:S66 family peptidase [Rossellomorea sp. NRS-1567]|uniref:S66 family peptidase n=1 Tax=Rossellomorea sp. NRS-1567 TaxID=3233901 RepID=UPI003D28D896
MIYYPEPLKQGDKIGIVAPSSGVTGIFEEKLNRAIQNIEKLGYSCIESPSLRQNEHLASASATIRAKEFEDLYNKDEIKAIIPPWGGQFLIDILPHLQFHNLKTPKWILGFSDISTLLFSVTLSKHFATAHGPNLLDFGNHMIDHSVLNSLKILSTNIGESFTQSELDFYQTEWLDMKEDYFPPYNLTEKVEWKSIIGDDNEFKGRLIGGCLDTIGKLIGTPYAPVKEYIEKFQKDGFVWYFESCEMNSSDIYRTLFQMRLAGWFNHCKGLLYGRPDGYQDVGGFTLEDALKKFNEGLDIPILYNVDLGHIPPQLTYVNGSLAEVSFLNGKGQIRQTLT